MLQHDRQMDFRIAAERRCIQALHGAQAASCLAALHITHHVDVLAAPAHKQVVHAKGEELSWVARFGLLRQYCII